MEIKQFYHSKTFWFNVITILIGIIEVLTKQYPLDPTILASIIGIGNLLLRFLDGQPIMVGKKKFGRQDTSPNPYAK